MSNETKLVDCDVLVVSDDSDSDATYFSESSAYLYFVEPSSRYGTIGDLESEGNVVRSVKVSDVLNLLNKHGLLESLTHTGR